MKTKILFIVFLTVCSINLFGQGTLGIDPNAATDISRQGIFAKTFAGTTIVTGLYNLAINNISNNNQAIKFNPSLYAIRSIFKPSLAKDVNYYKGFGFSHRFQPVINLPYKDNFTKIGGGIGFNYALIDKNDVTISKLLNNNLIIKNAIIAYDDSLVSLGHSLMSTYKDMTSLNNIYDEIQHFVVTGDSSNLPATIITLMKGMPLQSISIDNVSYTNLYDATIALNNLIQDYSDKAKRGWNVTASSLLTYSCFNNGAVQGFEFGLTALKGFLILKKLKIPTSQLVIDANYVIGDDSIVPTIETGRHLITDGIAWNQVIANHITNNPGAKSDTTSWLECSLTIGYNYVIQGLLPNENNNQPYFKLTPAILLGKQSWLNFPVVYNISNKTTTVSISISVNVGNAPIKN